MIYVEWFNARLGQMFCFAVGAILLGNGSEYDGSATKVAAGAVFMVTALVLRHQMMRRFGLYRV